MEKRRVRGQNAWPSSRTIMVSLAAQATRREMEKRWRSTKTCKYLRKLAMYADDAGPWRGRARKLLGTGFSGGI